MSVLVVPTTTSSSSALQSEIPPFGRHLPSETTDQTTGLIHRDIQPEPDASLRFVELSTGCLVRRRSWLMAWP